MKKIFFIIAVFLMLCKINAQDLIYKYDGIEIKSMVIEITTNAIKYKNFAQPDGPIRNLLISDVFMIIYKDGTKEVFNSKNKEAKQSVTIQNSSDINKNPANEQVKKVSVNSVSQKPAAKNIENEKGGALFLRGGFSPIIGFAGCEYFINRVGIEAGWGRLTAPISKETQSTFGIGLSIYLFNWYKSSPYVSIGFCADGAVKEAGITIYDTPNNYWVNLNSAYLGYRVVIGRIVDIKAGTGYRWSEYTSGFAFEATIGLKIFSNKIRK
jgi:hypothetical protein